MNASVEQTNLMIDEQCIGVVWMETMHLKDLGRRIYTNLPKRPHNASVEQTNLMIEEQ